MNEVLSRSETKYVRQALNNLAGVIPSVAIRCPRRFWCSDAEAAKQRALQAIDKLVEIDGHWNNLRIAAKQCKTNDDWAGIWDWLFGSLG